MRLHTAGKPSCFDRLVVGIVSRESLPIELRKDRIYVASNDAQCTDLSGYTGFVTTGVVNDSIPTPVISVTRDVEHLRSGDIISMDPGNGFIRTMYRPDSDHNVIFTTERCNSNCLMCSQPPQDVDDVDALTSRNLEMLRLLETPPAHLTITGGEPTLLGDKLLKLLSVLRDKFPSTPVQMLTNGRTLAWENFTSQLAAVRHPDLLLCIPVYSDNPSLHDHIVQAHGAFDQTIMGLHQAARHGLRTEVRVVLHALTVPRLPQLAEYIYRNLTFVEHVALMGLENIGYAPRNMQTLWTDPYEYQAELEQAVETLTTRFMNVSIYNHQLCILKKPLWKFARKSISDWKNIYLPECGNCHAREQCGGFFQWATKLHSAYIRPVQEGDGGFAE